MLLFFDACGKQSGHVDNVSGARQLNGPDEIHDYDNRKIQCLWLCMNSAVGSDAKKWALCRYLLTYPHICGYGVSNSSSTLSYFQILSGLQLP